MSRRSWTVLFMVLAFVLLLAWDAYVYFGAMDTEATISRIMWRTAEEWPLLPFAVGVLVGHFWWPQTPDITQRP